MIPEIFPILIEEGVESSTLQCFIISFTTTSTFLLSSSWFFSSFNADTMKSLFSFGLFEKCSRSASSMMVSGSLSDSSFGFLPLAESGVEFLSDVASSLGDEGGVDDEGGIDASSADVGDSLQSVCSTLIVPTHYFSI